MNDRVCVLGCTSVVLIASVVVAAVAVVGNVAATLWSKLASVTDCNSSTRATPS